MGAALGSLALIIASLGLSKAGAFVDELKSSAKKMSTVDITAVIDKMAAEARTKGNAVYNKLQNKLAAISNPIIQSATVKSAIQTRRREINKQISTVADNMNKLENELAPLTQKANSLTYMSDSFRSSDAGKGVLDNIKQSAQSHITNFSDILKGVEKNV